MSYGLMEVMSRHLPGGSAENYELEARRRCVRYSNRVKTVTAVPATNVRMIGE
jgi:hypothetical protein